MKYQYDNDNEIIFISIETFTHSYIHDKQWKYGKVKKSVDSEQSLG